MSTTDFEAVRVDLGDRSYDVLIGSGLLAGATDAIVDRLGESTRAFIVTDDNVGARHLATIADPLAAAGRLRGSLSMPAGEATKSFEQLQDRHGQAARGRCRAWRLRHRPRRWRHRRPCRVCRGDPAARGALRSGSDQSAGPGRFFRRRQDRDQHVARQESHRRIPSASPGTRRHGRAEDAAGAGNAVRLRRSGQVRPARRPRILRLAR